MSCICGHEYLLHGAGDHKEYKGCVKTGCECAEFRSEHQVFAEMLQALKALLEAATARVAPGLPDMDKAVARAVAVIAQAEGRP